MENQINQEENKFTQLCVWPGTILNETGKTTEEDIEKLNEFFKEQFDVRIKYECEVKTLPDYDGFGNAIKNTGGRNDLFFYIHSEDIQKFAFKRLQYGIRWWEDVISYNDTSRHLYTKEFIEKYPVTW